MESITGENHPLLNVTSNQLLDSIILSIDKGNVVFAGVSINNDFDTDRGWGDVDLYRPEIVLTKAEQSFLEIDDTELFKMKTTGPNHAILFVGYGTDTGKKDGKILYLLAENSWGDENGDDGYFRVSTEWVLQNCYQASILKECLPKGISKSPSKITEFECYESTGNLL
jgi:bleomycin hydrolase